MQGVGRSAAQHRDSILTNHSKPCSTAQTTSRNRKHSQANGCLKCSPEAQERRKRERKKQLVLSPDCSGLKHLNPTVQHPVPAFWCIEPMQGRPTRSTGLTKTRVPVQSVA